MAFLVPSDNVNNVPLPIEGGNPTAVKVDGSAVTQPVSGTVTATVAPNFATRSDTFTATGNGTTVDKSAAPVKQFAIEVKGTGAAATTWDVRLEASLDNVNFTTILTHTNVTGDGQVMWIGQLNAPTLYFRSRVAAVALGAATNIIVTILGM